MWRSAILASLLAALFAGARLLDPALGSLDRAILDAQFRLRGPLEPPTSVMLVKIDDADVGQFPSASEMRAALARTLDELTEAGAAVVAIDLLFDQHTTSDARLARAIARHGRVVLAAAQIDGVAEADRVPPGWLHRSAFRVVRGPLTRSDAQSPVLAGPVDILAGAAAAIGHVNVAQGSDGTIGRLPLAVMAAPRTALPALSLAAIRLARSAPPDAMALTFGAGVRLGDVTIPTDRDGQVAINHYGPPGTIQSVSLRDVLDGAMPADRVAGRVVFIGASASIFGDLVATPFHRAVPGAEVLATVTANIREDRLLKTGGAMAALTVGLAMGSSALMVLCVHRRSRRRAAGLAATVLLASTAAGQIAFWPFMQRLEMGSVLLAPLATLLLAAAIRWRHEGHALRRSNVERDRRDRLLSPLARKVLSRDTPPDAGGAAVVFADLVGSTSIAATLGAARNAALLGHVHRRLFHAAARHGGMVAEVLGDGGLIVFGPGGDPQSRSRAALAFAEDIVATPDRAQGITLRYRLTAASGEVRVAEFGDRSQAHLTVTGDPVNLASRLQAVAREAGRGVVIDEGLWKDAGEPEAFVSADTVRLPGIDGDVAIRTIRDGACGSV